MKKNIWQIDVLIIIALSFLINYLVVTFSKSGFGIIMGQIVNVLGVTIWLVFGLHRITGYKKSNRDKLINVFKNRCSLKCLSLAILVFILSKLSYSFFIEVEFIKNLDLLSNTLFKPVLLNAEFYSKNILIITVLSITFLTVGVLAEELFFRAYLFNLQYYLYGQHTWIINGISWSLIHVFARANVIALLPTAFLISWIYQRNRNFWVVFVAHLLINAVSMYSIIASYHF